MKKSVLILLLLLFVAALPSYAKKEEDVPKPVVVTFLKDNCDDCDALDMVRQSAEEEYGRRINFININIEDTDADYEKLMARYNIKTAPTTLFINSQYKITKKVSDYLPYNIYMKNIIEINR